MRTLERIRARGARPLCEDHTYDSRWRDAKGRVMASCHGGLCEFFDQFTCECGQIVCFDCSVTIPDALLPV